MNSPESTPEGAFAPLIFASAPFIEAVGPGLFELGGHVLRGHVLISPWGAAPWGGFDDSAPVLALEGRIDVLVLGGGAGIVLPPRPFRLALEGAGIGIEPMATALAVRTYNHLLGEGRRIALAAFALPALMR